MTLKKSSTGTSLHPLGKGKSCMSCKARKVRCDAKSPACSACLRSARFEHRDLSTVQCQYQERKLSKEKASTRSISGDQVDIVVKEKKVAKIRSVKRKRSFSIGSESVEDILVQMRTIEATPFTTTSTQRSIPYCSYPILNASPTTYSSSTTSRNLLDSTSSSHSHSPPDLNQFTFPIHSPESYCDHSYDFTSSFTPIESKIEYNLTQSISSSTQLPFYFDQQFSPRLLFNATDSNATYLNDSPSLSSFFPDQFDYFPSPTFNNNRQNENFTSTSQLPFDFSSIRNDKIEFDGYFGLDGLIASGKFECDGFCNSPQLRQRWY